MQDTPRIISVAELSRRSSLSIAGLYRLMQQRALDRPARISPGRVGWSSTYVDAWLAARVTPSADAA